MTWPDEACVAFASLVVPSSPRRSPDPGSRRVLAYTGGTLVMPMTVLVEEYWREISAGLEPYAEAARTWLPGEAEFVDTTHLTPAQAAQQIAEAVKS